MITRIWRGWTTASNAEAYERLLLGQILPGIAARGITGYLGVRVGRRQSGAEVEFVTAMTFASLDAVIAFAGPDYATAVVPPAARAVLAHYDAEATHYELVAATGTAATLSVPVGPA